MLLLFRCESSEMFYNWIISHLKHFNNICIAKKATTLHTKSIHNTLGRINQILYWDSEDYICFVSTHSFINVQYWLGYFYTKSNFTSIVRLFEK